MNKKFLKLDTIKNNFGMYVKKGDSINCIIYGATKSNELQGKIVLQKNSKLNFYLLLWQCQNLNIKTDFLLLGQNTKAEINILSLGSNQDKHHFDLYLNHQDKNTYSRLNFRRILWQQADSYSQEILKIDKGASGSDAYLSDKTVLIGNNSKVISKPILEILNDKVKASHSAISGRLSEQEIFYLKSRGLDEKRAKSLLLDSFIGEILPADKGIVNLIKQRLNSYAKR